MKPSSSKQNNLLNFFAKRNPRKVDDDSCEVLFEGPPKKATKWDEYVQKSGGNTSTAEGWENPCNIPVGSKSNDTLTKQALLENGFDETIGNFIYYPIDEIVRPFELNLVRCALSSNVCIALPSTAPSSTPRIMSITVANFLKWFPRSRALLLTYSSTSSAEWVESLKHLGIESSIIPSSSKKKVELNRVIISANPQAVKKFVDAEKEVSEDIRILILELKANECCNKYKPLMNELLVRDLAIAVFS
ncbi:unnamed protein product [Caenorhabditis angaria]|uniref:DEAD/DEAH box helicase domain-containing protein n=1 Tax=Caenorhabditis angaria TaxID=860376 RepID=A0A9P1I1Q5_9PELO|nr:unnamed protein product [Caenorhabditis angaria]